MPEITVQDKWVDMVPRFNLPKEFSNEPKPEAKPEPKPEVKPVEPPKVEAKETPTGETPDAKADSEDTDKAPDATSAEDGRAKKEQDWRERRMYRAQRRAAEAQARAEFLEKELAALKAQSTPPQKASTAPRMEDYTDVQEYAKAFAAHEKENALKEFQKKQQEDLQKAQVQKITEEWESQVSKVSNKYDDWDEIVGDLTPTTPWSIAVMRAENGADVAYHLGKHPAEARKIMGLDAYSQILEIGRLSAKLSAPVERPKTPSKAPAPIQPVQTESKPSGDEIRENQPFEEYLKVGNKLFGRGRR